MPAAARAEKTPRKIRPCKHGPRVQFSGMLRLLCPACGRIREYRIQPTVWKLTCKNEYCRRTFVLGWVLYVPEQRSGGDRPPDDYVFPAAALREWKPGELVHAVAELPK
jgi:hypothetical protein